MSKDVVRGCTIICNDIEEDTKTMVFLIVMCAQMVMMTMVTDYDDDDDGGYAHVDNRDDNGAHGDCDYSALRIIHFLCA